MQAGKLCGGSAQAGLLGRGATQVGWLWWEVRRSLGLVVGGCRMVVERISWL